MISFGALALGLVIVGSVTFLLLRRQLREKYAVLWLTIGLAVLLLGLFPQALSWLTVVLGFQLPANLIFTLAIGLLLAVALHLSWELTRTEERLRRLAEEAAITRLRQDRLEQELQSLRRDAEIASAADDSRDASTQEHDEREHDDIE